MYARVVHHREIFEIKYVPPVLVQVCSKFQLRSYIPTIYLLCTILHTLRGYITHGNVLVSRFKQAKQVGLILILADILHRAKFIVFVEMVLNLRTYV